MSNSDQQAPTIYYRIDEWFSDLSDQVKASLKTYHSELLRANRTISLISAKTLFVADAIHFADSIIACRTIYQSNKAIDKIFDLGSGNGFPGVVFAILYPNVQVVLVESDKKKCEFLEGLVKTLGLSNVTVENKTIESMADGSMNYAITRGLASISKAILLTRKSITKGGVIYHLKGEEWGIEVGQIPSQLCSMWSPSLVGEYKLPVGAVKFSIIKTDKIS